MLTLDPVRQEVLWRGIAQRGMSAPLVLERLDVVEGISDRFVTACVAPCTRSFLKLLKKLSVGALSQQFPFRFIEQIMPYAFSRARKAWL